MILVHLGQHAILFGVDVQVELAGALVGAGQAALAVGTTIVAVVAAGTEGVDLHGLVVNDPVHQVEVVGGLVDQQGAGVLADGVPAAEVLSAVDGIQQPLQVHGEHIADHAGGDQLLDADVEGHEAAVEGHGDLVAGALLGFDDAGGHFGSGGQRLLGDDVAAKLQGLDDVALVSVVAGGDDDHIGLLLFEHLVKVGVDGHFLAAQVLSDELSAGTVGVADGQQIGTIGVLLHHGLQVSHGSAPAGADQNVFLHCLFLLITSRHGRPGSRASR